MSSGTVTHGPSAGVGFISSLSVAWGGAPVIGGGGVMSSGTETSDPSVRDYADTSPASLGRKA
jgi:hypothetical protein